MRRTLLLTAVIAALVTPMVAADLGTVTEMALPIDPDTVQQDVQNLVAPEPEPAPDTPTAPPGDDAPRFADRVRDAFADEVMAFSAAGLATIALTIGGFAAVTRYISPKEALKNPQRSMLYGYIRATPGAHLKQLSEEFAMKTSSILWHIRKLESAELVKSERVNGYRVFYPCEGGIEVRRVSRALASLQNDNAARVFGYIERHPGTTVRALSDRLELHGGTARWHLRKLRDNGLLDELVQADASRFYPTPLGARALEAREGRAVDAPNPSTAGSPILSE
jgi:predicted transcriptional regulator